MTVPDMPEWVLHARKFIATGRQEFLAAALTACSDPAIHQFLSRPDVGDAPASAG